MSGCAHLDRIVAVGQAPIARMKRSNVATYTDVWAPVRAAFAAPSEAGSRGRGQGVLVQHARRPLRDVRGHKPVTSNLLFFQDVQAPALPATAGASTTRC